VGRSNSPEYSATTPSRPVGKPTYGISSHPGCSWAYTSFAKLSVKVRKGTVWEPDTTLMMLPWTSCSPGSESFATFAAPRTVTAYVTAGRWGPYIIYSGGQSGLNNTPYYTTSASAGIYERVAS
jgi:hypothetical protein